MKQLQNNSVLFTIVLLFKLVQSTPDWAETDNGEKYFIERDYQYTWFEAAHECNKRNLSLVTLDTAEKNFDMVKLLKKRFGLGVELWIGATASKVSNKEFVWASNGKPLNFTYWQVGEPNDDYGNQGCVHISSKSNVFKWANGYWNMKFGYICEESLSSFYIKELGRKRQEIKELGNKFLSFLLASQTRTEEIIEAQLALTNKINLEITEKFDETNKSIERTLENSKPF